MFAPGSKIQEWQTIVYRIRHPLPYDAIKNL